MGSGFRSCTLCHSGSGSAFLGYESSGHNT